jgi:hypothetical protein
MQTNDLIKYFTNSEAFEGLLIDSILKCNKNKVNTFTDNITDQLYRLSFDYGTKGKLYCLHNEMFNYYGNDVYKLGKTSNTDNRMNSYSTPYLEKSQYKLISEEVANYTLAENIFMDMLSEYRMRDNREFFKCSIPTIKTIMDKVIDMFNGIIPKFKLDNEVNKIKLDILSIINKNRLINKELSIHISVKLRNIKVYNKSKVINTYNDIIYAKDITCDLYTDYINRVELSNNQKLSVYRSHVISLA